MQSKTIIAIVGALVMLGGVVFIMQGSNSAREEVEVQALEQRDLSAGSEEVAESATRAGNTREIDDACAVFTANELSAGLGVTLGEGESDGYTPSKTADGLPLVQCEWEQNNADSPSDYTVHLDVYNFATPASAAADMSNARVTGGSLSYEDAAGVSDEALYARAGSEPYMQARFYWRDGNVVYHLSAVRLAGLDRAAVEEQLKNIAAAKF
jgi:hypothetical protein